MKNLLMIAALVVAVAVPAFAGPFSHDVSTAALQGPTVSGGPRAIVYSTGFEPAEGFVPGYIGGQAGWTTFAGSVAQAHVSNLNPYAGEQHMRISKEPLLGAGNLTGGFSPTLPPQPAGHYVTSLEVDISAVGGANYGVVAQAPSQGFLSARLEFDWNGNIWVLDNLGPGLAWVNTGTAWIAGAYKNLTIDLDAGANTINYYYNGSLFYTSFAGVYAGTAVEQVVLYSDNWQNSGEVGDFDNLNWTPEPGTLMLLGLGLVGLLRRR